MTICFVSDYHPTLPYFGGIAVYTQRIARALARRGHEVHIVVAKAADKSDGVDQGVHLHFRHVRWLPLIGGRFPGLGESIGIARILAGLNKLHHFDIVEVPNWEGLGLAATWVPNLPVVVRLHTSLAESIGMAGRQPNLAERFVIWAERTSSRRAKAVITHSDAHCQRMAATYGLDSITVIPHGIDLPSVVLPVRGRTILSIGGTSARKGMRYLLGAIPSVLDNVPDAFFKIVGIREEDAIAKEFRAVGNISADRVEFLGSVDSEHLYNLYDECALYVSPATYESFGLTFLEAMAHGRPVVGCATSAMPEVIDDGITGYLVPPESEGPLAAAITKLLLDDTMRDKMGAAARQAVKNRFSLDLAAERVEGFFSSILH